MAKRLVIYNTADNSIAGFLFVSQDEDAQKFKPEPGQKTLEIPVNSPARYDQANWRIKNGKLEHA